jgi:hypothetical protein
MRNFIFTILLAVCFVACSDNTDFQTENTQDGNMSLAIDTTVVVFNERKDIENFLKIEDDRGLNFSTDKFIQTRGGITDYEITGYSSVTTRISNQKCAFGGALAAEMGVSLSQIWMLIFIRLIKT